MTAEKGKVEPDGVPNDRRRPDERKEVIGDVWERRRGVQVLALDAGISFDEFANFYRSAGVDEGLELPVCLFTPKLDCRDFDDAVGFRVDARGLNVEGDPYLVERRCFQGSHVGVDVRIGTANLGVESHRTFDRNPHSCSNLSPTTGSIRNTDLTSLPREAFPI